MTDLADPGTASWSSEDPRLYVGYEARIVIVTNLDEAFFGYVHTKHGWYVQISGILNARDRDVGENSPWPIGWKWVFHPNRRTE